MGDSSLNIQFPSSIFKVSVLQSIVNSIIFISVFKDISFKIKLILSPTSTSKILKVSQLDTFKEIDINGFLHLFSSSSTYLSYVLCNLISFTTNSLEKTPYLYIEFKSLASAIILCSISESSVYVFLATI